MVTNDHASAAKVYAETQGYRLQSMRTAVGWIADRGPLRVSEARAAETLWAPAAPDTARLLVSGRGWTTDAYAEWLPDLLSSALLGPDHAENQ